MVVMVVMGSAVSAAAPSVSGEQSNQQLLLTITAQNSSPRLMLLHSRDHGGDANGGTGNTEDARDASSYISPDTMSPQCKSVLL